MIPFKNRFHGHGSLRFVYQNGEAVRSRLVTIKYIKNPHRKNSRIAIVISKKILKSAVGRNLIRRRLYELIRLKLADMKDIYDIAVIVTSSEFQTMAHIDIESELSKLFQDAKIV